MTPTTPQAPKPDGEAPAVFYPSIDAFLDYTCSLKPDASGSYLGVTAYEGFLMALLWRWELEDENGTQDELDEVNADLALLNDELGDAGRTAVMRQLVAWASRGDGWLYERINALANSKSPYEISTCKVEA